MILTSKILFNKIKNERVEVKSVCVKDIAMSDDLKIQDFTEGNIAAILYTSGTSGKPKGVMLTHENLIANTESILIYLPINKLDSTLIPLSFTYSYGNSVLLTHTKVGALIYLNNKKFQKDAVICGNERFSYKELYKRSLLLGEKILLNESDIVIMLMPSSTHYVVSYFATFYAGKIVYPISNLSKPFELMSSIEKTGSNLILCTHEY